MSLKRGKYSKQEEQYVIDNVHMQSIQEIADHLSRAVDSVERLVKRKKLKTVITQEDQEELDRLLNLLQESPHWEKVKLALTDKELELFQKDWIHVFGQFGEDVWYTEEKYIVDWLLLDIKKYRTYKLEKQALQEIERIEADLAREYALDVELRDTAAIAMMEQQLPMQQAAMGQHTNALKTILDRIEKIADKLKANREERRDTKANEDTFWGYVQMLEDEKFRKNESRQAQLMKLAQNKAREKLYEYHEYMDGEVDIPLLTPEIVLRKKKEEADERATGERATPSD